MYACWHLLSNMIYMEMHRDTAIPGSLWVSGTPWDPSTSMIIFSIEFRFWAFHIPFGTSKFQLPIRDSVCSECSDLTFENETVETVFVFLRFRDTIYEELPEVGIWCAACWQRGWHTTLSYTFGRCDMCNFRFLRFSTPWRLLCSCLFSVRLLSSAGWTLASLLVCSDASDATRSVRSWSPKCAKARI